MLLPDNIHPENTIYYNGAFVLETLTKNPNLDYIDLYSEVKEHKKMSMPIFTLCLDWLYLIDVINIENNGKINLCI